MGSFRVSVVVVAIFLSFINISSAVEHLPPAPRIDVAFDELGDNFSGWYLRGDLGWSRHNILSISGDIALSDESKLRNITSLNVGYGFRFSEWFRIDLTAEYRAQKYFNLSSGNNFDCPVALSGLIDQLTSVGLGHYPIYSQCRSVESAKLSHGMLFLNGYFDLGTWAAVTPYVGAGVGVAYGRASGKYDWIDTANNGPYQATLTRPDGFPSTWIDEFGNPGPVYQFGDQSKARSLNQTRFNFAWALMAGVAVDVSKNAKMELGYRYLNLGKWGNAKTANTAHDFRIGFRYNID